MNNPTLQFVTQMKLRELRSQRERLRAAYGKIEGELQEAAGPKDQLERLYHGLQAIEFAGQPLHPEAVNLDVLFAEAEAETLSPELQEFWLKQLSDELKTGKFRAEVMYLFGGLLEEWANKSGNSGQESQAQAQQLLEAQTEAASDVDLEFIDRIFESFGEGLPEFQQTLRERAEASFRQSVANHELIAALERLSRDSYRSPGLRGEAQRFLDNKILQKELADAITIMFGDIAGWDWPPAGVAPYAIWTQNKWRLYVEEDLPTACLLDILGQRWVQLLERMLGDLRRKTQSRVRKLQSLNAPQVILENEYRRLQQLSQLEGDEEFDLWKDFLPPAPTHAQQLPAYRSVVDQRTLAQRDLRNLMVAGDYTGDDYQNRLGTALGLVQAEIQLGQTAFGDQPLYLIKTDLRDYYASIPHEVILKILSGLGVSEPHLTFFRRFLSVRCQHQEGNLEFQRGVPNDHLLSGLLGELVLRLFDRYLSQQAHVMIVRYVDDICLLTPHREEAEKAWQAVQTFCRACGLQVNAEKSGSICLHGERPASLPEGNLVWGLIQLDDQGRWGVHWPTWEKHLAQAEDHFQHAPTLFSKLDYYNQSVHFLIRGLALEVPLDENHRREARQAAAKFHRCFLEKGILATLREEILARFPDLSLERLPESWMYYPITAGGLGLQNPMVSIAQYASAYQPPRPLPADEAPYPGWCRDENAWAEYYRQFLTTLLPAEPKQTKVMQTLVKDFIARGSSISGGRQQDLSSYWRWVLYTYGPEILNCFGTFRFLITELVPLQLITSQRAARNSEETSASGADEDIPF